MAKNLPMIRLTRFQFMELQVSNCGRCQTEIFKDLQIRRVAPVSVSLKILNFVCFEIFLSVPNIVLVPDCCGYSSAHKRGNVCSRGRKRRTFASASLFPHHGFLVYGRLHLWVCRLQHGPLRVLNLLTQAFVELNQPCQVTRIF